MKCSIVIPTFQRSELLSETLDSLASQTEKDFEVIVACDGEDLQTRRLAESYRADYPLKWLFENINRGQASARNSGACVAEGEILLFLDDDTIPVNDWVFQHWRHHAESSDAGEVAVYGRIIETYPNPPQSQMERLLREERDRALADVEDGYCRMQADFSRWACFGLNSSIRRRTFGTFGGFDPRLRFACEDAELGIRLHNSGFSFRFEPRAIVSHRNSKDLVEYCRSICQISGQSDAYRLREKHQRNSQIRTLTFIHRGSFLRRNAHRLAWDHPQVFGLFAGLCRRTVNATGSRHFFWLWHRFNMALYWEGVKTGGITLDWLCSQMASCSPTPVLMFHSLSFPTERSLRNHYLSPGRFSRFIRWLKRAGYKDLMPEEWLAGTAPTRSVMLTFDDGYDDFYSEAFPILKQMNLKATVFVVVERIGQSNVWDEANAYRKRNLLSLAQIRELHRHGIQFGSHSLTHPFLTQLSNADLRREVADSKRRLEDFLGSEVSCFAYPYGDVDARVCWAVAEAGYRIGMTTEEGLNFWNDPLCLKRSNVSEKDTMIEFVLKLATGRDYRQELKRRMQGCRFPETSRKS
jgi:peptidoglycan/xylan/chitin deacetylase (PgdA/CDA1 family)/GT2 family glycosyltransferase